MSTRLKFRMKKFFASNGFTNFAWNSSELRQNVEHE